MESEIIEPAVKACLAEIRAKLKAAEQIAKAAQACGGRRSGRSDPVFMDIEQLIYEAGRLHDAATLLARMGAQLTPSEYRWI